MAMKRIIACLDVRNGRVVKGVKFSNHADAGSISFLAEKYCQDGADELVFYDISASPERRSVDIAWIVAVAELIDIPFCVAGGIRSVNDAKAVIRAGADKISINTPALERPELIRELAQEFGSQAIVVGIDSRWDGETYRCWKNTGSVAKISRTAKPTSEWLEESVALGAGEIVMNCMDADGTRSGFDLRQLKQIGRRCKTPLIASGGAGSIEDFINVLQISGVDAALAASVLHSNTLTIPAIKAEIALNKIEVRP